MSYCASQPNQIFRILQKKSKIDTEAHQSAFQKEVFIPKVSAARFDRRNSLFCLVQPDQF